MEAALGNTSRHGVAGEAGAEGVGEARSGRRGWRGAATTRHGWGIFCFPTCDLGLFLRSATFGQEAAERQKPLRRFWHVDNNLKKKNLVIQLPIASQFFMPRQHLFSK